jgi:hypothetical protein
VDNLIEEHDTGWKPLVLQVGGNVGALTGDPIYPLAKLRLVRALVFEPLPHTFQVRCTEEAKTAAAAAAAAAA